MLGKNAVVYLSRVPSSGSESSESLPRFITTWGAIFWWGLSTRRAFGRAFGRTSGRTSGRRACRQRRRKKNHLIEAAPFGRLDQM